MEGTRFQGGDRGDEGMAMTRWDQRGDRPGDGTGLVMRRGHKKAPKSHFFPSVQVRWWVFPLIEQEPPQCTSGAGSCVPRLLLPPVTRVIVTLCRNSR